MARCEPERAAVSDEEYERVFKIYRDYVEHEDGLINHRTTWLIMIQSFLWATFGLSYQKKYEVLSHFLLELHGKPIAASVLAPFQNEYNGLLFVLALVGFCTSVIAYFSLIAATKAIDQLGRQWLAAPYNWKGAPYLPGLTGGGDRMATWSGGLMSKLLPLLFGVLWGMTLVVIAIGNKISFLWSY